MTLVRIQNTPRSYAWGSKTLMADLLGVETGEPLAEVWFGTHPVSPATALIQSPTLPTQTATPLADLLPAPLGFMVKFLAADQALSIQAHPNKEQAAAGFAAENLAGVAIDSAERNYKDPNHKPELLIAVSRFEALCGFRPQAEALTELQALSSSAPSLAGLAKALKTGGHRAAFGWIFAAAEGVADALKRLDPAGSTSPERAALLAQLAKLYPGDPGILVSLLMNHVLLQPGEALFLPAGNIHAYVQGLGVEVLAASDNVLRAGLTVKHVDVAELTKILDFDELVQPTVLPRVVAGGIKNYPIPVSDFSVYRLEPSATNLIVDVVLNQQAIVVCTAGEITISTSLDEILTLRPGEAAYLSNAARLFSVSGSGTAFMAMG